MMLGIVGGLGPESTIDYYRRILLEWKRDHPGSSPSIIIDSLDVDYGLRLVETDRPALVEYLSASLARLGAAGADFAAMARELADRFTADGIDLAKVTFERRGDLRYVGQGYELRVPFPDGTIDEAALAKAFAAFHEVHKREYGHHFADSAIEIVNLRLVGAASAAKIAKPAAGTAKSLDAARVRQGTGTFRVDGKLADYPTDFYRRDLLPVGERIAGPAIVLQMDSTTVVPPQHNFEADAAGNLIIRRNS